MVGGRTRSVLGVGDIRRNRLAGDLGVNEFLANPASVSDTLGEWFEIFNRPGDTVELNGI